MYEEEMKKTVVNVRHKIKLHKDELEYDTINENENAV